MNNFVLKAIFLVFFITLFTSFTYSDATISGCEVINDDELGQVLTLDSDINGWSASPCFYLDTALGDGNSLEIDCNNHNIDFNDDSYYLFSNSGWIISTVTFRRCNITVVSSNTYSSIFYFDGLTSNVNFIDSNLNQDVGRFIRFNIPNSQVDVNLYGSNLDLNSVFGFWSRGYSIGTLNVYNLNVDYFASSEYGLFSVDDLAGSDYNYINLFDSDINIFGTSNFYLTEIASSDALLAFDFNNTNVNYLSIKDLNLDSDANFITLSNDSDINWLFVEDSYLQLENLFFVNNNTSTDYNLSIRIQNSDVDYLGFYGLNVDYNNVDDRFLNVYPNSGVGEVAILNSDITVNGGVFFRTVWNTVDSYDINFSDSNILILNNAYGITFDNIDINNISIFNLDVEGSIDSFNSLIYFLNSDINSFSLTNSNVNQDSGNFLFLETVNNSSIYFDFTDTNLNLTTIDPILFFNSSEFENVNISNIDLLSSIISEFIYIQDTDINTFSLNFNNPVTLINGDLFYFKWVSDDELALNLNDCDFNLQTDSKLMTIVDSNLSTLSITDANLFDVNSADVVWVEGDSDINILDLNFFNTITLLDSTLVTLKSDDSNITLNLNNSDFNFQGSSKALMVTADLGTIVFNDLNIVTFNSTSAVYSISGDVNSFTSNLVDNAIVTNTTANLFMFVDTTISGLIIDMNNRDLNFANDVFWFDNSVVSDLNIKNVDLLDSTNLFTTINDANISNLYLYDSNIRYDTLFDINGRITAKLWNNYFIDENTDNNAIIIESPRVSSDVNVDFNIALTTATNIVSKSYKGGNYWTNTSATSPGTDTSGDYIYDTARLISQASDKNYYDYLPLTIVRSAEMQATDISLNSSVSGTTSTATCTVRNNGDVSGTPTSVKLYVEDVLTDTNSTAIAIAAGSTQTYKLDWAPSPTTNTTYDLNCIVTYTDWNSTNNNYSESATITYSSGSSGGSGGGSSEEESGIDLQAISLNYTGEVLVNKDMTFTFVFKNVGDEDATSSYTASIVITQKGETIKTLSQNYTEDLDSGSQKTYTATWKPTKAGYYSVEATIEYSGTDDDTGNDTIDDKVLHVVTSLTANTTSTNTTNNTSTITATKTIGANKTLQSVSDFNTFVKDLNIAIQGISELTLPDVTDVNNIYLPVEVTRTFKCDSNALTCDVTISLHNVGTSTMSGYKYIEILPDLNDNERYLTFDLNDVNTGLYSIFNYTLAASAIDANNQAKFFGLVTNDTSSVILPKKKSSWNFDLPWKTIGFVVLIIIGAGLLALVVVYLIKLIKSTRSGFRYYKTHESRAEEPTPKWKGLGGDDSGVKFKGGKYKVSEHKHTGPKYKGWK